MRFPRATRLIVTARHRSDLEDSILPAIQHFLTERGLTLSEEKTNIRHIRQGFDFLGQNLRKYSHGKLWITPSKKNVQAFLTKVRETTRTSRGHNLGTLIDKLNPKIRGWANYHRQSVSRKHYINVDHQIYQAVWRFLKKSHPNKSSQWIYKNYCRRDPKQRGRLTLSFKTNEVKPDGTANTKTKYLKAAATTARTMHLKVRGRANPYEPKDRPYFKWLRGLRKVIRAGQWKPPWNAG